MQQILKSSGLTRYFPILGWLPSYSFAWFRDDAVAGLTVAAIVIPQVIMYTSIIGVPVEAGLYTAIVPLVIYAIMGTSRPLSVSSTTAISMLTATYLAGVVQSNDPADFMAAASVLALLVGGLMLLAALLRLGFIANFVSIPVLTGFKAGIGVVLVVSQLDKVLGVTIDKGGVFQTIGSLFASLNETHLETLALALITVAILLSLPRITQRVPASLVVVVVGILAVSFLGLNERGVESIGTIPAGLPSFAFPDIALVKVLWPGALGIALLSFVESIALERSFAQRGDPPRDSNQELLAIGMANVGVSFFQGIPAGGGASQTAAMNQAGARSQMASIFVALTVVLTLVFLAPVVSLLPQATVGGLVVIVGASLIKLADFRAIAMVRKTELCWAIIAWIGVILFGVLQGILIAVVVSMFTLMAQANHPPVYVLGRRRGNNVFRPLRDHPDDETFPGLLMLRIEGRMHFASVPRAADRVWEIVNEQHPRVLAFECSAIPDFEYTAIVMLTEFEQTLRDSGIVLWLVALNPEALRVIRRAPIGEILGPERMFSNLELALETYQRMEKQT